jgi:perosamine synthetase
LKIPFHRPHITNKEFESIKDSLLSGWLTMGPKTLQFELAFKSYLNVDYSISVNSATAALHLALNAIGVKQGDEVIIPTNTFVATAEAVAYSGAMPVLCDIEPNNHNINVDLIQDLVTTKTKAIIPVHFGGNPCDMDEIKKYANHFNLKIIEDAAHALPASYKNKKIGTLSDAVCFSFYATKTLTTGEGGMVTTNNSKIAEKVRIQRLHGINGDAWKRYEQDNDWYYEVIDLGYKYNTTDIQSAIGLVQLEKLEWMRDERKMIAEKYKNAFAGKLNFINEDNNNESSWHLFVIKIGNRDELHQKLKEKGISTSVHFIPIHKHPYYKIRFNYENKDYPVANNVYQQSLSLPIYPGLDESDVEYIIKYVLEYAEDTNK